jgi:hypothetical protein
MLPGWPDEWRAPLGMIELNLGKFAPRPPPWP